jgi:hypothetical protein
MLLEPLGQLRISAFAELLQRVGNMPAKLFGGEVDGSSLRLVRSPVAPNNTMTQGPADFVCGGVSACAGVAVAIEFRSILLLISYGRIIG